MVSAKQMNKIIAFGNTFTFHSQLSTVNFSLDCERILYDSYLSFRISPAA